MSDLEFDRGKSPKKKHKHESSVPFAWMTRKSTVPDPIPSVRQKVKLKKHKAADQVVQSKKHPYPELLDISQITPLLVGTDQKTYIDHANKYLGWDINPNKPYKLNKKKLSKEEIAKFKAMGEPDPSQNYLELFTPDVISDLFTILNHDASNATKARFMIDELSHFGFKAAGGEGTNIVVLLHDRYPGVVFKLALDSNGIADNFNDEMLQYVIPRYTRVLARDLSGIVSVQERSITMSSARMKDFEGDIMRLLKQLSEKYLVADLSPVRFLNFGVARDGDFVIQDGSDLYPIDDMDHKVKCRNSVGWDEKKHKVLRCGGKLHYTTDFLAMVCEECGMEINPLELRPKSKEDDAGMVYQYRDSTTNEDRLELERQEIEVIRKRLSNVTPDGVRVDKRTDQEVSDEETESEISVPDEDLQNQVLETVVVEEETEDEDSGDAQNATFETPQDDDEDEETDDDGIVQAPMRSCDQPVDVKAMREALQSRTNEKFKAFAMKAAAMDEEPKEEETLPEAEQPQETPKDFVEYKVIPAKPHNDDTEDLPGIYITVHGNMDQAWNTYGLPIFVSADNGNVYTIAIRSGLLKTILDKVVDEDSDDYE